MGRKQSPFIGRREQAAGILYNRYTNVEDILVDGADKKRSAPEPDTPAVANGTVEEPAAKKSKKDKQQQQPAAANESVPAAAAGQQNGVADVEQQLSKKDKKKLKQQPQEAEAAAAAADGGDEAAAQEPQEQQQLTKKEKRKLRRQHLQPQQATGDQQQQAVVPEPTGNAEEAARIRQVLGFVDSGTTEQQPAAASAAAPDAPAAAASSKPSAGFTFNFSNLAAGAAASTEDAVAADTEAKLAAITAVDSADKDGFVPRRVFVGGMPYSYSREQVEEYWGWCGEVEALDLMTFPDTGRFRGIAFITFKSQEGADAALACDGEQLDGHTLKVERCKAVAVAKSLKAHVAAATRNNSQQQSQRGRNSSQQQQQQQQSPAAGVGGADGNGPGRTPGYNVAYVGNIAFEARPEDISALFEDCSVTKVRLHTDKDTRKSKGYAHVHFADEEGLEKAIAMSGTQLMGRGIKVSYGQPKKN